MASAGSQVDEFVSKAEEYSRAVAKKFNSSKISSWTDVFFHPRKAIPKLAGKGSLTEGAVNVALASLIQNTASFIIFSLAAVIFTLGLGLLYLPFIAAINISIILLTLFGWLVGTGLLHLIARLFGGTASFRDFAFANALTLSATCFFRTPILLLNLIPCLGAIANAAQLLLTLYGLYLVFLNLKFVHKLSDKNAILSLAAQVVLAIMLVAAIAIIVYVLFLSAFLAPLLLQLASR